MDLLGDIGHQDQLTSAREENSLLQAKVKELKALVQVLTVENESLKVENESLKAEVEIYRNEATLPSFSKLALGEEVASDDSTMDVESKKKKKSEPFVVSGNGIYPQKCHVSLANLHGNANLLSCALSPDDTVLATGGADATLRLCHWGRAYYNDDNENDQDTDDAVAAVVQSACAVSCEAPVIAAEFCPTLPHVVACASMDGSVKVIQYANNNNTSSTTTLVAQSQDVCKHSKYVRCLAWSPHHPHQHNASILASASADGVIYLHKVERLLSTSPSSSPSSKMMLDNDDDNNQQEFDDLQITKLESIHLQGAVESLCFVNDTTMVCYARNSPHLICFDLAADLNLSNNTTTTTTKSGGSSSPRKIHLNPCESDLHVSFAVMDLAVCSAESYHGSKYLAAATDTSRNIVIDFDTGKQIRNLYGHANDGYSQPKLVWNSSGQYVLGNTQDESCVVVWDVASSQIVDRLGGGTSSSSNTTTPTTARSSASSLSSSRHHHTFPIRDLCASHVSDTLVTTSFDKKTNLWFY